MPRARRKPTFWGTAKAKREGRYQPRPEKPKAPSASYAEKVYARKKRRKLEKKRAKAQSR